MGMTLDTGKVSEYSEVVHAEMELTFRNMHESPLWSSAAFHLQSSLQPPPRTPDEQVQGNTLGRFRATPL